MNVRRRFRFDQELDAALLGLCARGHWDSLNAMVEHILWAHVARVRKPSQRPRGRPKVSKHVKGADSPVENGFVQNAGIVEGGEE